MSQKNQSYTLIGKDRIAKVSLVLAEVISKPYENNDIQYPACLVEIYEKQTNMFVTCYVLSEFLIFPSYDLLIDYCNKSGKIALPPNHSSECGRAPPIAPELHTTTGSDTPILCPSQRGFSTEQFLSFILFLNFLFVLPVLGLYICYAVFFLGGVSDFFSAFYLFLTCFTAGIFGVLSFIKGG